MFEVQEHIMGKFLSLEKFSHSPVSHHSSNRITIPGILTTGRAQRKEWIGVPREAETYYLRNLYAIEKRKKK
jgi:hypothetical protein